jgi:hypothetical protein
VGYTEAEINAAIDQVETAKRNHPDGWGMLDALGLDPSGDFVLYAFENASSQMNRLNQEDDLRVVYAAGWLQGLAIGHSLVKDKL